ncbi:MAG: hypothetical protein AAF921_06065 [Cyanobacteria bacterium P01_D01_bin.44]
MELLTKVELTSESPKSLGDALLSRKLDPPTFLSDGKALDYALSNLQKTVSDFSEMTEFTALFLKYKVGIKPGSLPMVTS